MRVRFRPARRPLLVAGCKASRLALGALCLLGGFSFGVIRAYALEQPVHDLFYAGFYVFVPSGSVPSVSVINKSTDQMIGQIALPFVPKQIVVSEAAHLLAAIDGTNRMALVDLVSGQVQEIALSSTPQKLWLSGDATFVVAADPANGAISFVDLMHRRERAHMQVASPIRDVLLSADDRSLYVAADGLNGIGVVDVAQAQVVASIRPVGPATKIVGLTRSPDGLIDYAAAEDGRTMRFELPQDWPEGAIDARAGASEPAVNESKYLVTPIDVATDVGKLFPTGYGKYLVAADNSTGTVKLKATAAPASVATLRGLAAMSTIYSGWFDTVSIVASATESKLLAIDIDRLAPAGMIGLPGVPGPGNVTDDGSKLYVPIAGANAIAVVDLRNRRLMSTIPVNAEPSAAVMTRSFDICH